MFVKPSLYFAHANSFPGGSYKRLFSYLEKDFELQFIDKLGHNPKYPVTRHWLLLVEELIMNIERDCSGPVVGVGHSLGGALMFMAAHKRPDLFASIIIIDPPFLNGLPAFIYNIIRTLSIKWSDRMSPAALSLGRKDQWGSKREAVEYFSGKKLFKDFEKECIVDYVDAVTEAVEPDGVRLSFKVSVEVDIFRTLPTNAYRFRKPLSVPATFIAAATGSVCPPPFRARVVDRHKMKVETINGSHMAPFEFPEIVAQKIINTVFPDRS